MIDVLETANYDCTKCGACCRDAGEIVVEMDDLEIPIYLTRSVRGIMGSRLGSTNSGNVCAVTIPADGLLSAARSVIVSPAGSMRTVLEYAGNSIPAVLNAFWPVARLVSIQNKCPATPHRINSRGI